MKLHGVDLSFRVRSNFTEALHSSCIYLWQWCCGCSDGLQISRGRNRSQDHHHYVPDVMRRYNDEANFINNYKCEKSESVKEMCAPISVHSIGTSCAFNLSSTSARRKHKSANDTALIQTLNHASEDQTSGQGITFSSPVPTKILEGPPQSCTISKT